MLSVSDLTELACNIAIGLSAIDWIGIPLALIWYQLPEVLSSVECSTTAEPFARFLATELHFVNILNAHKNQIALPLTSAASQMFHQSKWRGNFDSPFSHGLVKVLNFIFYLNLFKFHVKIVRHFTKFWNIVFFFSNSCENCSTFSHGLYSCWKRAASFSRSKLWTTSNVELGLIERLEAGESSPKSCHRWWFGITSSD